MNKKIFIHARDIQVFSRIFREIKPGKAEGEATVVQSSITRGFETRVLSRSPSSIFPLFILFFSSKYFFIQFPKRNACVFR